MKRTKSIIVVILLSLTANAFAIGPTVSDKYELSVNEIHYIRKEGGVFLQLSVRLTNNTGKVLKYLSALCNWEAFYKVTGSKFKLLTAPDCTNNSPVVLSISPHDSKVVYLLLRKPDGPNISQAKLRILFDLTIVDNERDFYDDYLFHNRAKKLKHIKLSTNQIRTPLQAGD